MPFTTFLTALALGSIPTAFVFAGLGAGWADYPVLVFAVSYVLPIALLPLVLHLMHRIGE